MSTKLKFFFWIVLLLLLAFFGVKALFHPGFYTSHDGHHQLIRLMHFDRGLRNGQLPVRWAGTALEGYGYPLFIFTYRLPFWIGEVWRLLGNSLVDSVKFSFVLAYWLSGITIFLFLRDLVKNKTAAFLGTAAFLWAPYRFSDIYVRAALGESFCFVFIPLIFWALYRLRRNSSQKFLILGFFSLAFLFLSHGLIFFLAFPFISFWGLCLLFRYRGKKNRFFLSFLLMLVLAAGLSCYYWLPAFSERKFIIFSQVLSGMFFQHFPTLEQLIYSPWGYGFSGLGENDGMSFQVGLSFWFAAFLAFLMILWRLIKKKRVEIGFMLFFWLNFFLVLFLMLPYSAFLWRLMMKFLIIDFPWRYLFLTTFLGAVLTALVYKNLKSRVLRFLFLGGCLFLIVYGNRNHLRVNLYVDYPDKVLMKSVDTSNSYKDYKPIWIEGQKISLDDPLFQLEEGEADFQKLKEDSYQFEFKARVKSQKAKFYLKKTWYPGWQSLVDGKRKKVLNCGGKICFNLPTGEHFIKLWFRETKLRLLADLTSLFFLTGVIFWLFHSRIKKREK